jgi:riboflavin synthase
LSVTTLGAHALGARVNLERATQLGARMGGHIVSGHVDGQGALVSKEAAGEAWSLRFSMPKSLARYVAQKGSITVNGISLTVNAVSDATFDVTIIPRTWRDTSLGDLALSGKVNLEVDLVARYLERLVTTADPTTDAAWLSRLERAGYK